MAANRPARFRAVWSRERQRCSSASCGPAIACVDVGAHVGYHALLAARLVGASGRIFAIDPQPYNCAKILSNAELNGFTNITVIAAAVDDADGLIALKNQSRRDKARLTLGGPGVNDGALTFVVPKITLRWLIETYRLQPVNLVKVDVEGFELEVLNGASDAIRAVENIVFEVLPGEDADRSRAIERVLRDFGFQMFDVEGVVWRPGQACVENNVWARRS